METLFARRPSPVTNGPAAYGAEPWLGGVRGEQKSASMGDMGSE